jgi:uncharacterized membrane protein YfcA
MTGYGFLVGLASSLMGISGGSLVTMVLTVYRKPVRSGAPAVDEHNGGL